MIEKPIHRSKLRLFLGKQYYMGKKHLSWLKYHDHYACSIDEMEEKHIIFQHRTPLRRALKAVDQVYNDGKIVNLSIAVKTMNHLIIEPNQTFSYWKTIGKPSKRKGYVPGMVLDHGSFKLGTGGGLCQLSNMLFWMVLHTPLTVVERHRHSYDVFPDVNRKQPFGSGATCVYNYRDFQFRNETKERYQLAFNLDDQYLYGTVYADIPKYFDYEIYESSHEFKQTYWSAYTRHNTINRKTKDLNGNIIADDYLFENHALMMYSPLLQERNE